MARGEFKYVEIVTLARSHGFRSTSNQAIASVVRIHMTLVANTVLLVDDSTRILDSYKRLLRGDFLVDTAQGGKEGLAVIRERGPFTVVISDVDMRRMKGVDFLSAVTEVAPDTVQMLLSGTDNLPLTVRNGNQAGVFRILVKPATETDLRKALADAFHYYYLAMSHRHRETDGLLSAEARQRSLVAQLLHAQKMDSLGQLTGRIAHDLNNLLGVVLGNLDFLEEYVPRESEQAKMIKAATAGALRGVELTKSLLAFTRQESRVSTPTHLGTLLMSSLKSLRTLLPDKISIESNICDDLWFVLIEKTQLESALLNLTLNACDAMPFGGCLEISAKNVSLNDDPNKSSSRPEKSDYIEILVSDSGIGMSPVVSARAFEPFFTTKGSRGTGLGLSIVHSFVIQSGGFVRLSSEPGNGTSIRIYLPRAN